MLQNNDTLYTEPQEYRCNLCNVKFTRKYNLTEHNKTLRHRLKNAEQIINDNKKGDDDIVNNINDSKKIDVINTLPKVKYLDHLICKYPNHILSLKHIINIVTDDIRKNYYEFDESSINEILDIIHRAKLYENQQNKMFNYTFESLNNLK